MLDVAPSLGKTGEHAAESPRRPLPAAGMAYPTPAPDTQARPMLPPEAPPLDPDEPDNAATLFYQPGLKSLATAQALVDVKPPAGPPRPPGQDPTLPSSAGLGAKDSAGDPKSQSFEPSPSKVIFTMPLEQARAAAMNLPDPTRSTGSFAARPASEGWSGAQDALSNPGAPGVALAPAAPSRTWLWIVVGVVVALGAAAAVYFVLLA